MVNNNNLSIFDGIISAKRPIVPNDLSPYQNMLHKIGQYTIALKYEVLQYQRVCNFSPYPNPERDTLYHDMIQDILIEINILIETLKCIIKNHKPNIVLSNLKQLVRTK